MNTKTNTKQKQNIKPKAVKEKGKFHLQQIKFSKGPTSIQIHPYITPSYK